MLPRTDKMSDALTCFTYLAENAPLWIKSLDELQLRIQSRQGEVARVTVPIAQQLKKTSSNESIRHSGPNTSSPSAGLEITSAPQAYHLQQTTASTTPIIPPSRKRKTMSLVSAASAAHKYRSSASITVYYDSDVQEAFDRLVRNISIGRNNIRKSRMADRVATMAAAAKHSPQNRVPMLRTVRSSSGMPRFNAYVEENLRFHGRVGLRPPSSSFPLVSTTKSETAVQQKNDAKEDADAALDRAQGFCERGAHQFLRDGDCGEEVAGAKAAFEEVIGISRLEIESLEREVVAAAEEEQAARFKREQATKQNEVDSAHQHRESISHHPALIQATNFIEADDDEEASSEDDDDPASLPSPPFRLIART